MQLSRLHHLCSAKSSPRSFSNPFKRRIRAHNSLSQWNPANTSTKLHSLSITTSTKTSKKIDWAAHALRLLRESINEHKHTKWGFLIYRCDYHYHSAETWNRFLSNIQRDLDENLEVLNAMDLAPTMDYKVIEDREALNCAGVDRVRDIFRDWVRGKETDDEQRDVPPNARGYDRTPRYTYCIQADADSLDSIANHAPQPPRKDSYYVGCVNLIHLHRHDFQDWDKDRAYNNLEEWEADPSSSYEDMDEGVLVDHRDYELGDENLLKISPEEMCCPEGYARLFDPNRFDQIWRHER